MKVYPEISTVSARPGGVGQTVQPPVMVASVIHALTGPPVNLGQDLTGLSYIFNEIHFWYNFTLEYFCSKSVERINWLIIIVVQKTQIVVYRGTCILSVYFP